MRRPHRARRPVALFGAARAETIRLRRPICAQESAGCHNVPVHYRSRPPAGSSIDTAPEQFDHSERYVGLVLRPVRIVCFRTIWRRRALIGAVFQELVELAAIGRMRPSA